MPRCFCCTTDDGEVKAREMMAAYVRPHASLVSFHLGCQQHAYSNGCKTTFKAADGIAEDWDLKQRQPFSALVKFYHFIKERQCEIKTAMNK